MNYAKVNIRERKLSKLQESLFNGMSHLSIDALQFVTKYRLKYRFAKENKPHNTDKKLMFYYVCRE